jgi:hypothetical protein
MPAHFEILQPLLRHRVPFLIVGGHAVNFHGYRRATEDADVLWLRSERAEEGLFKALLEMDAHYIGREIDPAMRIERTFAVTLPWIARFFLRHLAYRWQARPDDPLFRWTMKIFSDVGSIR